MNFLKRMLSVFFPHRCTFCKSAIEYTNNTYICEKCKISLPYVEEDKCAKCNRPISPTAFPVCYNCRHYKYAFEKSFTPLIYTGNVRKSLLSMKFYDKESYCKSYAILIAENILLNDFPHMDFITYVPLSPKSLCERGYNQCEIIAKQLGDILKLPIQSTLSRIDGTPKQSGLSLVERRKNAKASFLAKDEKISGTVLLIDDIYTTGSTTDYCSKLLLKMGAEKVYIATVALKTKN